LNVVSPSNPNVPLYTAVKVPSSVPYSFPIQHVTTVIIHEKTTYYVHAQVSSSAPPIFIYTYSVVQTIVVRPSQTTLLPANIPSSLLPPGVSVPTSPIYIHISTIPSLSPASIPATSVLPYSPVVVFISSVPSTVDYITVPGQPSVVIVNSHDIHSTISQ
jgi:hypothetical protein